MKHTLIFKNQYFLFLIIPVLIGLGIMFFLYPKKIRYQKKRVITLTLSFLYFLIIIFMVSGLYIKKKTKNYRDEIIFLVDNSFSAMTEQNKIKDFINEALKIKTKKEKAGIILFGKNHKEVKQLSYSNTIKKDIFNINLNRRMTNLSDAINYALSKFINPKKGKIVLISDLKTTDKSPGDLIEKTLQSGVALDILYLDSKLDSAEQEIISLNIMSKPTLKKPTTLELNIKSNIKTKATIKILDNGREIINETKDINKGDNLYKFSHKFKDLGIHKLETRLFSDNDKIKDNNSYITFLNIENPNRILLIENKNEGNDLYNTLKENFNVSKINTKNLPKKIEELLCYDLVILANTSKKDLGDSFLNILDEYCKKRGGTLLTTGGFNLLADGKKEPNIYNPKYTKETILEDMLPIKTELYTPPIAVCFVIDNSGSMGTTLINSGKTYIREAADRAIASLDALDDRDYVSFITFTSDAKVEVPLTLKSKLDEIKEELNRLDCEMQGTVYSPAIEKATLILNSIDTVNKKHIIFLSDGEPSGGDSAYYDKIRSARNNGITLSTVSFLTEVKIMEKMSKIGGGKHYYAKSGELLEKQLKNDLQEKELREYEEKEFKPKLVNKDVLFSNFNKEDLPIIKSFYGSKLKKDSKVLLKGSYNQPIFSYRNYGFGKTASFMIDLDKNNTPDFFKGKSKILLEEIIQTIMPSEPVKNQDIGLDIIKDKSTFFVSTNTNLLKDEKLKLVLEEVNARNNIIKEIDLKDFSKMEILELIIDKQGLYKISINKYKNNKIISKKDKYICLEKDLESIVFYSKDDEDKNNYLLKKYKHLLIDKPKDVYEKLLYNVESTKNAKTLLIIIFMILFLFDIFLSRINIGKNKNNNKIKI